METRRLLKFGPRPGVATARPPLVRRERTAADLGYRNGHRSFVGRRLTAAEIERLSEISLTDAGFGIKVRQVADLLSINSLLDLALAWPWQVDRLRRTRAPLRAFRSAIDRGLSGDIVPEPADWSPLPAATGIRDGVESAEGPVPHLVAGRRLSEIEAAAAREHSILELLLSPRALAVVAASAISSIDSLARADTRVLQRTRNCSAVTLRELRTKTNDWLQGLARRRTRSLNRVRRRPSGQQTSG